MSILNDLLCTSLLAVRETGQGVLIVVARGTSPKTVFEKRDCVLLRLVVIEREGLQPSAQAAAVVAEHEARAKGKQKQEVIEYVRHSMDPTGSGRCKPREYLYSRRHLTARLCYWSFVQNLLFLL